MNTIKLYTEYQVREMLKKAFWQDFYEDITEESLISELTPIELPTDEEIEESAKEFVVSHDFSLLTNPNHLANRCFQLGAKYVRNKIQGGNK